jgi:hypothetical protein
LIHLLLGVFPVGTKKAVPRFEHTELVRERFQLLQSLPRINKIVKINNIIVIASFPGYTSTFPISQIG